MSICIVKTTQAGALALCDYGASIIAKKPTTLLLPTSNRFVTDFMLYTLRIDFADLQRAKRQVWLDWHVVTFQKKSDEIKA